VIAVCKHLLIKKFAVKFKRSLLHFKMSNIYAISFKESLCLLKCIPYKAARKKVLLMHKTERNAKYARVLVLILDFRGRQRSSGTEPSNYNAVSLQIFGISSSWHSSPCEKNINCDWYNLTSFHRLKLIGNYTVSTSWTSLVLFKIMFDTLKDGNTSRVKSIVLFMLQNINHKKFVLRFLKLPLH
jgi:hypothetical protein